jgi:hypothetical protein
MGLTDEDRERLTAIFYQQLAQYVPSTRPYRKRPTGDDLAAINRRHDAVLGANPWLRLALEEIPPDA